MFKDKTIFQRLFSYIFQRLLFYLNILMTTQKVRYKQTIKNNLKKFHLILTVYLDPCFYHLVIIFIK